MKSRADRGGGRWAALLGMTGALALSACATAPRSGPSAAGRPIPPVADAPPQPHRPLSDSPVKVGKPYQVANIWYYPSDDLAYDEVGYASWYGPGFHGGATANGEPFDQDSFGAAHKTLPLPCYVEVTALDTGRTILVRINDRGPYVGNRIIDLSRRSAEALGIAHRGVSRVRVRRVQPPEADRIALRSGYAARSRPITTSMELVGLNDRLDRQKRETPKPLAIGDYIQVAAFADRTRAETVARQLDAVITYAGTLWRVRLGPYFDQASVDAALAHVRAQGYQDARQIPPPVAAN